MERIDGLLNRKPCTTACIFIGHRKTLEVPGGFHTGMDLAMKAGYEWLWIMDDDSIPNENALERLLDADHELAGAYGWLSSRALWKDGTLCRMNIQRSTPYVI